MALISKGIELYLKTTDGGNFTFGTAGTKGLLIPDIQEIGELTAGGAAERDKIEVTTLAHDKHEFVDGLQVESEYEGITFKALYNPTVYAEISAHMVALDADKTVPEWVVTIPSGGQFNITGRCALKFDGAAVNSALTMTFTITPTAEITFDVE